MSKTRAWLPTSPGLCFHFYRAGGPGVDAAKCPGQDERSPGQVLAGSGYCKWFNVRMGFGFISMTHSEGRPVEPPLDVFVHQVSPPELFFLFIKLIS